MYSTDIKFIRKRDGRLEPFDPKKIENAIFASAKAVGGEDIAKAREITRQAISFLEVLYKGDRVPTVENVQDLVEKILIEDGHAKTAKAYILYREQHAKLRQTKALLSDAVNMVDNYIQQKDWRVKENANMGFSLQGLNNFISTAVSNKYWLDRIYPKEIAEVHLEGDIHIHDLGSISAYCCGWDLKDLLTRGFGGAYGKVESNAPRHFRVALGQIVNFFYTLQGEAAGAQAFSNFDTLLAPFVYYDKLSYPQVKQYMQEFIFNINVPTRVGFQTPFTNITMDLTIPNSFKDEAVVVGGEIKDKKYGDFQHEADLINKAFCDVMSAGDAKGRIFSFPIPTYNITKDFDWTNPDLKGLWEMTARYGIPYFSNFVNSDMNPDDARSMCPLAGDEKVLIKSSRKRGVEYSTIRNIYEGNSKQEKYEIYSDGKFVSGRFNKFNDQKMIKVILENGHEIKMTARHLNYVISGPGGKEKTLKAEEVRTGMYLPYSLSAYKGKGGNADLGYFVGAYAGDGSFDGDGTVVFSLEKHYKKEVIAKVERIATDYFGANSTVKEYKGTKLVSLKIHSQAAVGLCRDYVEGKERIKCYKARLFTTSLEFRKGVIKGHYDTDGGNRNRIYTSSRKMLETLNMLAATLGTTTSIYKDGREGRFGKEPNYAVLIYQLNRRKYGKIWFKKGKKLWVRIKEIKHISNNTAYCFEVGKGEPIFTVGTTGILTHNCRLRLDNRQLRKRGGGLFGSNPLTGSIGVVTLNIPRLAYMSGGDKERFYKGLDELLRISKEALEIKRKILDQLTEQGLYPYSRYYLADIKKRHGTYWANHFSTIGLVGVNEGCVNLLKEGIDTKRGRTFALELLNYIRERMMEFQEETGHFYNLEATPAEGTTYRLAKMDREKYPGIVTQGEEEPYYTNSTNLPVKYTEDLFGALDHQDDIQSLYTGGTVFHIFLGERVEDSEVCKKLIRKIAQNYRMPYFTISPSFTICSTHGYIPGEHFVCPYDEAGGEHEHADKEVLT
ncbi:ribonucleoside triphosphate reductase [Candidatus Omnitrophota bacterium]